MLPEANEATGIRMLADNAAVSSRSCASMLSAAVPSTLSVPNTLGPAVLRVSIRTAPFLGNDGDATNSLIGSLLCASSQSTIHRAQLIRSTALRHAGAARPHAVEHLDIVPGRPAAAKWAFRWRPPAVPRRTVRARGQLGRDTRHARLEDGGQRRAAPQTAVDEIADGIFRLSTFVPDIGPTGFTFNQFVVRAEQPLLFHTGPRGMFPLVHAALATLIDPATVRWITFGHLEADEVRQR